MSLNYPIQTILPVLGSKSASGVESPATLTNYYNFDGATSDYISTGGMPKVELLCTYTAGTGETGNSVQLIVESSDDKVNWYRIVNESVSGATSTLTQREFTIAQSTSYGTLGYDAQSANFTVGLLVTDGTTGATGIIEADTDGGTTGTLLLSNISSGAAFANNNAITDSGTGAATINGILTSITKFSLPLDISSHWIRISAKETGVASNYGTIFVEAIVSGE